MRLFLFLLLVTSGCVAETRVTVRQATTSKPDVGLEITVRQ